MQPDTEKILTASDGCSSEFCKDHVKMCAILRRVADNAERTREHVEKIIIGLYGDLAKCDSGFIHEIREDRAFTRGKMAEYEQAIVDIKKLFSRIMVALVSAIASLTLATYAAFVSGIFGG